MHLSYGWSQFLKLPSQFLSLMKNRVQKSTAAKKVSARCQGTFGHPVVNPDQTDATNLQSPKMKTSISSWRGFESHFSHQNKISVIFNKMTLSSKIYLSVSDRILLVEELRDI